MYIAGVAESPLGEVHDETELSMAAKASREALAEAGMTLDDVDGLLVNYMGEEGSVQVGEYLGVQPRWADSTDIGGGAFEAFVHHAATAIAQGRCDVALITYASRQRSRRARTKTSAMMEPRPDSLSAQFQSPFGLPQPIGQYALIAARHMAQFGTTSEQLAEVAVAARAWAGMNPKAWSREPMTVEDVLSSRMISDPLHKLDCCLVTDGGGAVVLTHRDRARDAAKRAIRVLGAGESHMHWHISQMPDLTVSPGVVSGREAFEVAGLSPSDVDVLELYDAFTINVVMHLEDLGFCRKGEGGAFLEDGRLRPGGSLPTNTQGGGLSYCHPGAFGILLLVEAVRQLRGESGERQVEGARIALAHGMGGVHSTAATVLLGRD